MSGPLLIVGASGRAAAASAIRAGNKPTVIDQFADADTKVLAKTIRCDNYPHGLTELTMQLPPMPWMYTGGLENYPDIVDAISERHRLVGNQSDVIRAVRNPFRLHELVRGLKCRMPPMYSRSAKVDIAEGWLKKYYRSAGGSGVQVYDGVIHLESDYYLQKNVRGVNVSAAYEDDRLIGISEQLCGTEWLHAPRFHYAGNLLRDDHPHESTFKHLANIGRHLVHPFELKGSWGLDAIDDGERLWIIELNPRYTASMELFEQKVDTGIAKAIYYAPSRITFPENGPWDESLANCRDVTKLHDYADIPEPGTVIEPGRPVLTFFVPAPSVFLGMYNMKEKAAELDRLFGVTP